MSEISRRAFLATITAGTGLALVGCEGAVQQSGSAKAREGIITLGADPGSSNQFVENWNIYISAGGAAPAVGLIWEPLFRITNKEGGTLAPVLAESVEYSADGMVATYKLRQDVTWSDGERFDAEDVVYSYNEVFGPPKAGDVTTFLRKKVYQTDDFTVVCEYNFPNTQQDTNLALYYPILPKHVYAKQEDRKKFQDKKPVGTGPCRLATYSPQRIILQVRDDYWAGRIEGVKQIEIVPHGTPANIQSAITKGDIDWAMGGGPGVAKTFTGMDPANAYHLYPNGSTRGVQFQCATAPFDNEQLRIAFRDAVDPTVIQASINTGYEIPTAAALSPLLFANMLAAPYDKPMAQNADSAMAALAKSGYAVKDGVLTKDGKEYPLTLDVNLTATEDIVAGPILCSQWKQVLGVDVKYNGLSDKTFNDNLGKHKFHLAIFGTTFNGSPYNTYQAYLLENLDPAKQAMGYGNQGLWPISDEGNELLHDLKEIPRDDLDKTADLIRRLQVVFGDSAPVIPYQGLGAQVLWTTKNWNGFPLPDAVDDFRPQFDSYGDPVQTIKVLAPNRT